MGPEMRERVNEVTRRRAAKGELTPKLTADYVDQEPTHAWFDRGRTMFVAYTPWGIACIEAAFLDRMQVAATWDSKDLIRKDILANPHLHLNIKDRLLQEFEKADWARWHDNHYAKRIMGGELEGLEDEIRQCPNLTPESRDNLLLNLKIVQQGA